MSERVTDPTERTTRAIDTLIHRWMVVAPAISGILGVLLGTAWGFVMGVWVYHDHEVRIESLEKFRNERVATLDEFKVDQARLHASIGAIIDDMKDRIMLDERFMGIKR